jgi:thioredoxin-like negative regulator of GroEL
VNVDMVSIFRAVVIVATACGMALTMAQAAALPAGVQWLPAAASPDVETAFKSARAADKPLLLYWGATWCPPCNQLKATLFNRQDFAALSKSFVAVHVDGDRPGAQKLGQRFKVGGYPTLVLFKPDGSEITRLPGEADAEQVMDLLRLGLAGGRPATQVLADARAGKTLTPPEWRLLAFYSFETDDEQLVAKGEAAAVLAELAVASGAAGAAAGPETTTRLWLRAAAASDDGKGLKADEPLRERVRRVLADPAQVRAHADVIINGAPGIVRMLADSPEARQPFAAAFEPALRRLEAAPALSRNDRLTALVSRIELARLEAPRRDLRPTLPDALLREVRDHAAGADRDITDAYERQAVIPFAAYALERAGLWADGEALLKANLDRSVSPYYLMSQLGSMARKLGRSDEALQWYAKSFDQSQGPATRLQWGAGYLQALVDLAPADGKRIEATAGRLFDEAARDSGAFYKRSAGSLRRVGRALVAWNKDGQQAAGIRRLQARLDRVCRTVEQADQRRATCQGLLAAATGKPAA